MNQKLTAPVAAKHSSIRERHGRKFKDNYEWLRNKEDAETIAYLEAENAYTEQETAHLESLRQAIFQEIKGRVQETDMSVPQRSGKYWYYGRTEEGKSYGISCRIPVEEGADAWTPPDISEPPANEEILLDLNELAAGHEFFSLGASTVTTSGRYLAYSIDTSGDERFELRVKDLETGEHLADNIHDVFYGATWVGEDYLFYQRVDEAWRPDSVWRHKIGTPTSADVQVFHEADQRYGVGVGGTRSEKFLLIEVASKVTSEFWVLDQSNPEAEFTCLSPRCQNVEYAVDHALIDGTDTWIVTHNAHGPNFEVGSTPVYQADGNFTTLDFEKMQVLMPHRDEVRIEGVDCYLHQIVVGYRSGAIGRVAIMRLPGGAFEELLCDEELFSLGALGHPEWDAPVLRMSYESYITPATIFDYEVATGARHIRKQQEVLGGYDSSKYEARRVWVPSRDGVQIPVSLIQRKDLDSTQPNPTLLYGYGSYEASMDPGFSVARLSLLDRGMIFAVAHIRGGGEMGRRWYDDGKMLKKKNTFYDFIDVADYLLEAGITSREQLVGLGGSAGGLLIGAVANMAGDRFKALQAVVPFVDPLTSILMPELPLTVIEWDEWGDPYHDPEVYDYMASYAPYENVDAKPYPNIMAITSLNDTRVLYVEPAKWIAKLRDTATAGEFLLKTEMVAGHGGVSGRYSRWEQTAFEYAWIIAQATGKEE